MAQVAVDADAIFGGDHKVAGGRTFLFRTIVGVRADVNDFFGIAKLVVNAVALVDEGR